MYITLTINTTAKKSSNKSYTKPSKDWRKKLNSKKRHFTDRFAQSIKQNLRAVYNEILSLKQHTKTA